MFGSTWYLASTPKKVFENIEELETGNDDEEEQVESNAEDYETIHSLEYIITLFEEHSEFRNVGIEVAEKLKLQE